MADQSYTIYTTTDGDRWDQIAFKAYGVATMVAPIIQANPGILVQDKLPAGIKLMIPILDQSAVSTPSEVLPPWKR